MKKLMIVVSGLCGVMALGGTLDKAWICGTTDKSPISYKPGEKMTFTLVLKDLDGELKDGEYFLDWRRTGDDGIVENGRVPAAQGLVYSTKLDKAGFVRLQASVVDKNGTKYKKQYLGDTTTPEGRAAMNRFERQNRTVFFDGGAGVDINTLQNIPEPSDFDAFWQKQYERLAKVPIKADMIEVKSPNPAARVYAVRVDCAGLRPVTGYLSIPRAVETGATFPAHLETHGYSGDGCKHIQPGYASPSEIVFNINAHGLKLVEFGATEADTKALRWETRSHDCTYAFDPKQNADPEVAYFNGMVLRVKRALQYLKTLKGWNGKDLIASGGSQGGLQTIWAAGCGEGVTLANSGITWCCDMFTNGKLRKDPSLKLAADGWYIPWVEGLGYYDAVNFAKRIPTTCHTFISRAGLGDYCCPPTGLAKLYNAIPGNKEILWVQGSQHGYVPPQYEGRDVKIKD